MIKRSKLWKTHYIDDAFTFTYHLYQLTTYKLSSKTGSSTLGWTVIGSDWIIRHWIHHCARATNRTKWTNRIDSKIGCPSICNWNKKCKPLSLSKCFISSEATQVKCEQHHQQETSDTSFIICCVHTVDVEQFISISPHFKHVIQRFSMYPHSENAIFVLVTNFAECQWLDLLSYCDIIYKYLTC